MVQPNLPLEFDESSDDALRRAWARSGLPIPYHVALRSRALVLCLRCLAEAMGKNAPAGADSDFVTTLDEEVNLGV